MTIKTPEGASGTDSSPAAGTLALEERTTKRRLADNQPTTFLEKLKDNLYYMRGRGALEIGGIYAVLLVVFVSISLANPSGFAFTSSSNLSGVISQAVPVLALLAIGAGVLMIAGEFDLSIGLVMAFSAIIFIKVANESGWVLGVIAAIVAAVAATTINGLIVIITGIPSFIATLGMAFAWKGASILVNGDAPAYLSAGRSETFTQVFAGDYGFFRSQLLWLIVIGVACWFLLHRHREGNKMFAVGGNPAAAKAVSIKPKVVKLKAFAFLGLMIGITAVLVAARTNTMQPGTTETYTLLAIAAAVVGGCSLTGGRGTIIGMIIGAALLRTIENGLLLAHAPGFYVQAFFGVSIVVAAIFNKFMEGKAT